MMARWQEWTKKFAAMKPSERALVTAALVGGILLLGYTYAVEPALKKRAAMEKQAAGQETLAQDLEAQILLLRAQIAESEKSGKERLARAEAAVADLDVRLEAAKERLVPPERVRPLLRDVLAARQGLKLVALRSRPVTPLIEAAPTAPAAKDGGKEVAKAEPTLKVFRHGFEVVVQGGYADLTEYLAQLERLPQRLYWQKLELGGEYPRLTLGITVFTLSLSEEWLKL
ncbi:MAG: hypothetical protein JNM82_14615 [Rhodocyclaceae bacterium]|nr:hypothetical protein [Rhodocyclaceae bacterium]